MDLEQLEMINSIISDKFDFRLRISKRPNVNLWIARSECKVLHWYLNTKLGIPTGKRQSVRIPGWILDEKDFIVAFLSGFYDAEGDVGKSSNGPKIMAGVRRRDFFVPQMVVGRISTECAAQSARAGALYFAETDKQLKHAFSNIFSKGSIIPNLTVVKVGGSSFDYDKQVPDAKNIEALCNALWTLHQEDKDERGFSLNRMMLTVGAGQFGEIVKDYYRKYKDNPNVEKSFPELMAKALQANLEQLHTHFDRQNASLISTGIFYFVGDRKTRNKIPLIGMAPHYILARDGIPLQDSDTHTIALAEFYGAKRVVLVKRTDGIYDFDPYLGFVSDHETGKCSSVRKWIGSQRKNKRHEVVNVNDLLGGNISRAGTNFNLGTYDGSTSHLMEDSALEYFKYCRHVEEILVVHIAPEEMYQATLVGNNYKHVITGERAKIGEEGWQGLLENRLRNAFNGQAQSKIIR